MRTLSLTLILLSAAVCLSSCGTYQYVTVASNEVRKDTGNKLSWENDTLRLLYAYTGTDGQVSLSVTNKTAEPLYLNWRKSALINRGNATSLFNGNVQVSGTFEANRYGYGRPSGDLKSSFTLPDGMEFIPPNSTFSRELQIFLNPGELALTGSAEQPRKVKAKSGVIQYTAYTFDSLTSPLQFRSYLTFAIGINDHMKEFALSHAFYAQSVITSAKAPRFFNAYDKAQMFVMRVPQK